MEDIGILNNYGCLQKEDEREKTYELDFKKTEKVTRKGDKKKKKLDLNIQ